MATNGLVIAGLGSGSGKTTLTLGILRALSRRGVAVGAAKTGPDYIDGAFLAAACGTPAVNLDAHAMPADMLRHLAYAQSPPFLLIEGVMGLFDGSDGGSGSTAALAGILGLPVLLVMDVRHQAQTAAAIAAGMRGLLPDNSRMAGVVLNRIASSRHEQLIATALGAYDIALFGSLPSHRDITVPSRHLGLVQAADLSADNRLEPFLESAADLVDRHLDLDSICAAAGPIAPQDAVPGFLPPPGQRVAIAKDAAFGFSYLHMLRYWQAAGAEILPFSPLADEAPASDADAVFLPGGYPELHLPTLSTATTFLGGLRSAAMKGLPVYGECGGFMTLGDSITDAEGTSFRMAGLLSLETSFADRKLHLGYRRVSPRHKAWPAPGPLTAHEFHYSTAIKASGTPLFDAMDAGGHSLPPMGLKRDNVFGSYAHIIA